MFNNNICVGRREIELNRVTNEINNSVNNQLIEVRNVNTIAAELQGQRLTHKAAYLLPCSGHDGSFRFDMIGGNKDMICHEKRSMRLAADVHHDDSGSSSFPPLVQLNHTSNVGGSPLQDGNQSSSLEKEVVSEVDPISSTHADANEASKSSSFNDASIRGASNNNDEFNIQSEAIMALSEEILQDAHSMGEILCGTSNLAFSVSQEDINEWNQLADVILSEHIPIVVNESEISTIQLEDVFSSYRDMRKKGIHEYHKEKAAALRLKGSSELDLRQQLEGYPDLDTLIDLLSAGQPSFMIDSFSPNGGVAFKQSNGYAKAAPLCHHAVAKLYKKGRVMLLPWDLLSADEKKMFHISPFTWAPKSDAWEGRTCLNLSHPGKSGMSLNNSTDTQRSDEFYRPTVWPTVADLCEMAETLRAKYPESNIHGATIDVASAYQQFSLSFDAARFRVSILNVNNVRVLVVYLVGVFGDTRASHVYNVI